MITKITIEEKKNIIVCVDSLESLRKIINELSVFSKIILLTHKRLWDLYKDKLKKSNLFFHLIFLPEGEEVKNIKYLMFLYEELVKIRATRDTLFLIFGGGVLGDIGGFVSSTYMRGISYIQIPTTLLAMVDSSIGGKTAINFEQSKNLIGSFYQPKAILCDISLLETLPLKEVYNGFGEILKYSIINKTIYDLLSKKGKDSFLDSNFLQNDNTKKLILECIKTKLQIVKKDEKEIFQIREVLNLGHTVAHAIEAATNYKIYSHGEAVILGLLAEICIANKSKILKDRDYSKILDLINDYTKGISFKNEFLKISPKKIFWYLQFDKKIRNKKIRFTLPTSIGSVKIFDNIDRKNIFEGISFLYDWILGK